MVIVAGKAIDSIGITGFMMGLKPDIIAIYQYFSVSRFISVVFSFVFFILTPRCCGHNFIMV